MSKSKKRTLRILFFCLTIGSFTTQAQQLITGTVTSQDKETLIGVNIKINGTQIGVSTNQDGRYSLTASPSDTLVFSYIGFLTEEIVVGAVTIIDVSLVPDIATLSEIVVVGYGVQQKSDITGSMASIKPREFEQLPVARVDQALQGRVAGVLVQNTDASPNSNTTIRIRGYGSITGGNDPLVVIDGLQGGNLNTINPNDIESIEVLKDASATAIYGSRGSNGVILVTTKKGKNGSAPVITYSTFFTLSQLRKKLDLMNSEQYAVTVNQNRVELGGQPVYSNAELSAFKNKGGTSWQDAIFRNGFSQNHTLSVSGGNDAVSYYISGNYLGQSGIILNSSYSRYSLRSNIQSSLSKKVTLGLNTFIAHEADHPIALNSFAGANSGSPVYSAMLWSPTKAIYDSTGAYTLPGGGAGPKTNYNPVALAKEPIHDYYYNAINVAANLSYEIATGLKFTVLGTYILNDSENNDYLNSRPSGQSGTEVGSIVNRRNASYLNTNMLTYERRIKNHSIKVMGVVEQQYQEFNGSYAGAAGFFTNAISYNNIGLGQNVLPPSSDRSTRSLLSYMGRLNYNFNDRFLLTITGRADGSSVFGQNNKWGFFPSGAIGWNISNESFMRNLHNTVSELKLRASYGLVGNQAIPPYGSLASLNSSSQYSLNGTNLNPGASFNQAPNPNIKWEKTTQFNAGLDLDLFEGRINLSADFYQKETTDLLFNVSLPKTSGYSTQLRNVGSLENKGFELYFGVKPLINEFKWETGFTLGVNRNKVLSLYTGTNNNPVSELPTPAPSSGITALPGFTNSFWLQTGQPIAVFKGYVFDGIWKQSETSTAALYGAMPGSAKYRDVNGDGKIDSKDFVSIGNAVPKFSFGWNNRFSCKNFDVNIFIQGVHGNKIYNLSRVRMETTTSDGDATSTKVLNRWSEQNENTNVPSFTGSLTEQFTSSRWLEDGSYIRIKNIAIGYRLPQPVLQKLRLSSCRIYFSGTNLFTKTNYSGFDPEASAQTDALAGVDLATYPSQKSYTVGMDIKF